MKSVLEWNPDLDSGTGKFWITLQDFCHTMQLFLSVVFRLHLKIPRKTIGRGMRDVTGVLTCATGHLNPQWSLEVRKRAPLFITLSQGQPDEEQGLDQGYIMLALLPQSNALGRPLMQADMEVSGFQFSGKPRKQQQVSIDARSVKPGHYIIICCTFEPYHHADFSLAFTPRLKVVWVR